MDIISNISKNAKASQSYPAYDGEEEEALAQLDLAMEESRNIIEESIGLEFPETTFPSVPILLRTSGLYVRRTRRFPYTPIPGNTIKPSSANPNTPLPSVPIELEQAAATPKIPHLPIFYKEELRLDVDGLYPQMTASGTIYSLFYNVHWIANLRKVKPRIYVGNIWYTHGDTANFRYTDVKIITTGNLFKGKKAVITFSGAGLINRTITLKYESPYFHKVEFEFDYEEGITPLTAINTYDHPNRPASLPNETLTIEKVFNRAGFGTTSLPEETPVPPALKGSDGLWSNNEMHDAMQTYWSKFADVPQWSLWVFFAQQHEWGFGLGGIMFDDIGPNHRQGTSLFYNSFISQAPPSDTAPDAWIRRMQFWTAVHEMGHSFNLAHSWQKTHPAGTPWIPMTDEPEARSFMNYPYNVSGGQAAFFSDFQFRFSDQELLFMRHAPYQFVQMGNADWFDNHGFQWANVALEPALTLEVRVQREKAEFDFLEPVSIELKLKNISVLPAILNKKILEDLHDMTIVVKRDNNPAKLFRPFSTYCFREEMMALQPGESIYASQFISAGTKGWIIDEPGYYTVQVCIHEEKQDIVSNALRIRVKPPVNYDAAYVAQDFYSSDEVARILSFNGSMVMDKGNDILRDVSERMKNSKAADHANLALAAPLAKDYKVLDIPKDPRKAITAAANLDSKIKVVKANRDEARKLYSQVFENQNDDPRKAQKKLDNALTTIGNIDGKKQIDAYTDLIKSDNKEEALKVQKNLAAVFTAKKVVPSVIEDIRNKIETIQNS